MDSGVHQGFTLSTAAFVWSVEALLRRFLLDFGPDGECTCRRRRPPRPWPGSPRARRGHLCSVSASGLVPEPAKCAATPPWRLPARAFLVVDCAAALATASPDRADTWKLLLALPSVSGLGGGPDRGPRPDLAEAHRQGPSALAMQVADAGAALGVGLPICTRHTRAAGPPRPSSVGPHAPRLGPGGGRRPPLLGPPRRAAHVEVLSARTLAASQRTRGEWEPPLSRPPPRRQRLGRPPPWPALALRLRLGHPRVGPSALRGAGPPRPCAWPPAPLSLCKAGARGHVKSCCAHVHRPQVREADEEPFVFFLPLSFSFISAMSHLDLLRPAFRCFYSLR